MAEEVTTTVLQWQRRICWPEPDAVCLEGGCVHCNDAPFRPVDELLDDARTRQRDEGGKDLVAAFWWGYQRHWPNTEQRKLRVPEGAE